MATLLSYALCTLQDVKESLGIDAGNTASDNIIIRKINQATDIIENYCNLAEDHHFKQTTYTNETYNGSGSDQLTFLMRPVTSISSFQYRNSGENIDSWDSYDSEDYFLDSQSGTLGLLSTQNIRFGSYRVSYTAGYSTIPSALSEACATLASFLVENGTSGTNVKRKKEGQRELEYFQVGGNQGSGSESLVEQLNLDETLSRYKLYPL